MATSNVKRDLNNIAAGIAANEAKAENLLVELQEINADYGKYPTRYADSITEVEDYTPTGAFETLADDELAKLTTQFMAARVKIQAAIAALE